MLDDYFEDECIGWFWGSDEFDRQAMPPPELRAKNMDPVPLADSSSSSSPAAPPASTLALPPAPPVINPPLGEHEYTYGYDDMMVKAWRKPINSTRTAPEFAEAIYNRSGDSDTSAARAVFKDGTEWCISSLSKADYQAKITGRPTRAVPPQPKKAAKATGRGKGAAKGSGAANSGDNWKGVHGEIGDIVRCVWLKAEGLASLRVKSSSEKERQICQCSQTSVGAQQAAMDIMNAVGVQFCNGAIAIADVFSSRDVMVKAYKHTVQTAKVIKKVTQDKSAREIDSYHAEDESEEETEAEEDEGAEDGEEESALEKSEEEE